MGRRRRRRRRRPVRVVIIAVWTYMLTHLRMNPSEHRPMMWTI
jgi:hypothetical protein